MQNSNVEDTRNVIPRWRSPSVLPAWEIAPARNLNLRPLTIDDFEDHLQIWRKEGSVSAAVDIYDTGILLSDKTLQLEGIGPILANSRDVPEKLLQAVRRSLAPELDIGARRENLSKFEQNKEYIRYTIRVLKKRINEHPRDAVSILEIARLHVLIGQVAQAEKFIRRAIHLSPNSRLILRSAVQYYCLLGGLEEILPALWKNESTKYDPLLQSAEIAAADLSSRGSRFAASALQSLKGAKVVDITKSELALAVATIEHNSGSAQRRVFQMVRAGLPNGTENAQAQAVWLGEQASRGLDSMLPDLKLSEDAYEARALALFEREDYEGAVKQALAWLNDQPFQTDPVALICNIHAVYLRTSKEALPIAERCGRIHWDNWAIQNATLLVFIQAGELDRASEVLSNLERLASTPTIRAFAAAGAGMLAFARNDIADGRQQYTRAIEEARRAQRPDLVYSAAVFWIAAETTAGIIDRTELATLGKVVTGSIRKLPPDNRDYATKLWRTIERQCEETVAERAATDSGWLLKPLNEVFDALPNVIE